MAPLLQPLPDNVINVMRQNVWSSFGVLLIGIPDLDLIKSGSSDFQSNAKSENGFVADHTNWKSITGRILKH